MLEQINIRKAELTKRLLDRKTREAGLDDILDEANKKLNAVNEEIAGLKEKESALLAKSREWRDKSRENARLMEEASTEYHKSVSRLESLKTLPSAMMAMVTASSVLWSRKLKIRGFSEWFQILSRWISAMR